MSSRTAPTADNNTDQLLRNKVEKGEKYAAAETALAEAEERRKNPRPEDNTREKLLKLNGEIESLQVDVDVARGKYQQASEEHAAAQALIDKERQTKLRADLDRTGAHLMRGAPAQYDKPLREMIMPFVNDVACYYRAVQEINQALGPDEEPIVNLFEAMRQTPGTPDQVVEVEVERRVRPEGHYYGQPGEQAQWPVRKVLEKQIVPGQSRINPTPLHEAFKAPALRPGEQNYRVEGTRDGHFIDVNGADY
jgi:hypothetical protein